MMDQFTFITRRQGIKITKEFDFETEPTDSNSLIFNVSRLSDDFKFSLSYNDFINNFDTIFQNDEAILDKWLGNSFDLEKTNFATIDRNSFIRKYNSKPLIDAISTERSGFSNTEVNLDITKPFVLHFIADRERNNNNQRISVALSDINNEKLLIQRTSSSLFAVFGDFNKTLGEENNYAFSSSSNEYQFQLHTFYFDGTNPLKYFLNAAEKSNYRVLGTNTGYFRTSVDGFKGVILNTRSATNSFRGKASRYKYLKYKQIDQSFDLQAEMTGIINQYNL